MASGLPHHPAAAGWSAAAAVAGWSAAAAVAGWSAAPAVAGWSGLKAAATCLLTVAEEVAHQAGNASDLRESDDQHRCRLNGIDRLHRRCLIDLRGGGVFFRHRLAGEDGSKEGSDRDCPEDESAADVQRQAGSGRRVRVTQRLSGSTRTACSTQPFQFVVVSAAAPENPIANGGGAALLHHPNLDDPPRLESEPLVGKALALCDPLRIRLENLTKSRSAQAGNDRHSRTRGHIRNAEPLETDSAWFQLAR